MIDLGKIHMPNLIFINDYPYAQQVIHKFIFIRNTSHNFIYNIDGLKDHPRSGRLPGLSCENKLDLKNAVIASPENHGYSSGVWTWALVVDFISKKFGKTYKKSHIYNILHSLNLSYQRGKGFFPEACDREEKVRDVKKIL